ncbi:MAG: hypothetical protein ACREMI_10555 [Gemmatimonadales bacterium]
MTGATALRAPVPREILPLIAAVAIGGLLAGVLAATPVLFITTPVVAAALAAAAALGKRAPEWSRVAEGTLMQLPDGSARTLLGDLLRRAAAAPETAHADPLVYAACEAARQLAALELHLAAFDAQARVPNSSPRWRDALQRCQRGRDLLTERLQDASAALSRWQAAQGSGESLGELARELNDESRYQQEAAHEVEALLA